MKHSYWSRALNWSQGLQIGIKDQDKSNCDLAYMAFFWKESLGLDQKKELKGELMVWKTKV